MTSAKFFRGPGSLKTSGPFARSGVHALFLATQQVPFVDKTSPSQGRRQGVEKIR
ncbi:hypothetical protein BDBG_17597 [Blastomyces gilchristii SLH14081]|uniref:Uncharacterized protein n=1 Tax=Blastomyces gilchristii (strain SLH14081) TaxID=559298 RepID=A0A179UVP9_BLAGS|nr:uncharacterized protein BDBG_17597 [Blastomyces gilchristii SLH14081]OAT11910.1 hypothetical protein BDBG_17597 [Blastomyces gilchristii SLH14081]